MPTTAQSARQLVDWQHNLEKKWEKLRFGEVKVETIGEQHLYEIHVYLNDLDPNTVRVELYAEGIGDRWSDTAGDEARSPTGGCVGWLRIQRVRVCGSPAIRLYGASDPALRWRCGSAGSLLTFCGSEGKFRG